MTGPVGFVGLGNMGAVLAGNLVGAGLPVLTCDRAGPERSPAGATFVADLRELAARADVVVCSLPDGDASASVLDAVLDAPARRTAHVVDTSTVGVAAARTLSGRAEAAGVGYVDAPVSGGVAGARARTLVVMYAGAPAACQAVRPVLDGLSDRRHRVGDRPGMAQALKLANNFLSATALAATSEAVAFGASVGLDLATMLEVLNASSGRSAATEDKFVHHVLPGTYAAGFANTLMAKDVRLYLEAVAEAGTADEVGRTTSSLWQRYAQDRPGEDFTAVHRFVAGT